jgi:hypothetical protein
MANICPFRDDTLDGGGGPTPEHHVEPAGHLESASRRARMIGWRRTGLFRPLFGWTANQARRLTLRTTRFRAFRMRFVPPLFPPLRRNGMDVQVTPRLVFSTTWHYP